MITHLQVQIDHKMIPQKRDNRIQHEVFHRTDDSNPIRPPAIPRKLLDGLFRVSEMFL